MDRVRADAVDGLTVADVMHDEFTTLPAAATVAEVRAWFAVSESRRLALLADGRRYAGALTPADLADEAIADAAPALEHADAGPTLAPGTPAAAGRDVVLQSATRRVPVVDGDGRLVGVLAMTKDLQHFSCRAPVR